MSEIQRDLQNRYYLSHGFKLDPLLQINGVIYTFHLRQFRAFRYQVDFTKQKHQQYIPNSFAYVTWLQQEIHCSVALRLTVFHLHQSIFTDHLDLFIHPQSLLLYFFWVLPNPAFIGQLHPGLVAGANTYRQTTTLTYTHTQNQGPITTQINQRNPHMHRKNTQATFRNAPHPPTRKSIHSRAHLQIGHKPSLS